MVKKEEKQEIKKDSKKEKKVVKKTAGKIVEKKMQVSKIRKLENVKLQGNRNL